MDRIRQREEILYGRELLPFAWHRLSRMDMLLFALGSAFCFFTMYYSDITITSRFSLTFIDSLFDGKLLSFYDNALRLGVAPEGAVYDIGIYIVFAVWGLPVWILQKIAGLDPMSVGSLLWFKLLLVVFLLGSVKILGRIAEKLGYSKTVQVYIRIIYLASATLLFPILVAAQYDIVPLFFMLLGVDYWLADRQKGFLLCFALAMTMKPFAILPFIALVLLKEKRIRVILFWLAGAVIPMLGLKGMYSFSAGYRESCGNFLTKMLPVLLHLSSPIDNVDMSWFVFGLLCIYIFSYAWKRNEDVVRSNRIAVLTIAGVWAVFCLLVEIYPYWSIYFTPFFVLIVFMGGRNRNLSLILDFVFNVSITAVFVFAFDWVYGGTRTFSYLILKPLYQSLVGEQGVLPVATALRMLSVDLFLPAFGAAMAASVLGVFACAGLALYQRSNEDQGEIDVWHVRIRILFLYGWIAACLFMFVFSFRR